MIYIGIDPGLAGGMAQLGDSVFIDLAVPIVDRTTTMPTITIKKAKGQKREYDIHAIVEWLRAIPTDQKCCAALELVHSMPKQGVASSFHFGKGFGIIQGILCALNIPYELVTPQRWMKLMLEGRPKGKGSSIIKVKELFPEMRDLKRTEHGKADAILLAEYLRRTHRDQENKR